MADFVWIAVGDARTCDDCEFRSGSVMPLEHWESVGLPGDGATICADNCRCVVMMDDLVRAIAISDGLSADLSIDEIIELWGLGAGIRFIPAVVQDSLISAGLADLAELDYEDAHAEILDLLRTRGDFEDTYEVMSLRELTEIYRGG